MSRWEADHLALVVAESREAADAGAQAIEAEWEELAIVGDIDDALASDALMLHPENGLETNAYHSYKIRKGDMAAGWAAAAALSKQPTKCPTRSMPTFSQKPVTPISTMKAG